MSGSRDSTARVWSRDAPHMLSFCPRHEHHLPDPSILTKDLRLKQDGWLIGVNNRLILWIPPEYRGRLMWPGMQRVISTIPHVSLDFSRFVHGMEWWRCYEPGNS